MATTSSNRLPVDSDSDALEEAPEESSDATASIVRGSAPPGANRAWLKYGKGIVVAALVLSAFASGVAVGKNISSVPVRSDVGRSVGLVSSPAEMGLLVSQLTSGKTWAEIEGIYGALRNGTNVSDPTLNSIITYIESDPAAKALLLASLAQSEAAGSPATTMAPSEANATNSTR